MTEPENQPPQLPRAAIDNIETVGRLHEQATRRRSLGEKMADGVGDAVGRVEFVAIHAAWFAIWIGLNAGLLRFVPVFDPFPYNLFGTLVSLEAVIIAAFVLIKQNRMSMIQEHRSHVELQLTLLTEQQVTKLLSLLDKMAQRFGMEDAVDDETRELRQHVEVEQVAAAVRATLSETEASNPDA